MSGRCWLLAGLFGLTFLGNGGMAAEVAPRWLSSWEEGRKEARATGKPIFVVFRCQH